MKVMNDRVRFSWSEVMYLYNFTETVVVKRSVSWNSLCMPLFIFIVLLHTQWCGCTWYSPADLQLTVTLEHSRSPRAQPGFHCGWGQNGALPRSPLPTVLTVTAALKSAQVQWQRTALKIRGRLRDNVFLCLKKLQEKWRLKAPEIHTANNSGVSLCNLISALTTPAKARAAVKSGMRFVSVASL